MCSMGSHGFSPPAIAGGFGGAAAPPTGARDSARLKLVISDPTGPIGSHGVPWGPIGPHGVSRGPMGSHGVPEMNRAPRGPIGSQN